MTVSESTNTLSKLILDCTTEPNSAKWEAGWKKLISTYRTYLFSVIRNHCKVLNFGDKGHSLEDNVNDFVQEVFIELTKNNAQPLRNFKNRQNEQAFKIYIATIAKRIASRGILKTFHQVSDIDIMDDSLEKNDDYFSYYFEEIVSQVRQQTRTQEKNAERDLLLFNLVTLENHSKAMLMHYPIFKNIGDRVRDNVVNRVRQKIKKSLKEMR